MYRGASATGKKGAFNTHEKSGTHKMVVECLVILHSSYRNVGEMLSLQYTRHKHNNRGYLFKVFQNIQFLARQEIAMRGDLHESDSNFMQLLMLRVIDDPMIEQTLEKKTDEYTSPQTQSLLFEYSETLVILSDLLHIIHSWLMR